MSVHLLVQVEELPGWRINGIFCALMQIPGVQMVTDLATTSQETLDVMLMPKQAESVAKPKRRKARVA